jgi:hypothetical protein
MMLFFVTPIEASVVEAIEATCQINQCYSDGKVRSGGTGTIFHQDDEKVFIMTAAHVLNGEHSYLVVYFYGTGQASHGMRATVEHKAYGQGGKDIAIISIKKKSFNDHPIPKSIPIAKKGTITVGGQRLLSNGCPKLNWPSAWMGHFVKDLGDTFWFKPRPIPGRSGSAIFDDKGEHIIGIIIQYRSDGNGVAVSLEGIYKFTEDLKAIKPKSDSQSVTYEYENFLKIAWLQ